MEMNIDAANWIPVIYKTELEPSSLSGFIPTLIIIGINWEVILCTFIHFRSVYMVMCFRFLFVHDA